jgi:SAM-dependent methyltransferase
VHPGNEKSMTEAGAPGDTLDFFRPEDFARDDESPDAAFYKTPRFVNHLDSLALSTVEGLLVRLIPNGAAILDLMAGPDSHLSSQCEPASVTGLGMNQEELDGNLSLDSRVVHDVNADPKLPFQDNAFDVVVNTVSVDYLTRPVEVFRDVGRVLTPDGRFIVVFSNRMFPPKAVHIWRRSSEEQRVDLVKRYLSLAGNLWIEGSFESKNKPRPQDDKYYSFGIPSDPIYAVWAKARK